MLIKLYLYIDAWHSDCKVKRPFCVFFAKMKYSDSHTLHGSACQFTVAEVARQLLVYFVVTLSEGWGR